MGKSTPSLGYPRESSRIHLGGRTVDLAAEISQAGDDPNEGARRLLYLTLKACTTKAISQNESHRDHPSHLGLLSVSIPTEISKHQTRTTVEGVAESVAQSLKHFVTTVTEDGAESRRYLRELADSCQRYVVEGETALNVSTVMSSVATKLEQ
jgi:hypothetical protein